jgi:hypothetical protein
MHVRQCVFSRMERLRKPGAATGPARARASAAGASVARQAASSSGVSARRAAAARAAASAARQRAARLMPARPAASSSAAASGLREGARPRRPICAACPPAAARARRRQGALCPRAPGPRARRRAAPCAPTESLTLSDAQGRPSAARSAAMTRRWRSSLRATAGTGCTLSSALEAACPGNRCSRPVRGAPRSWRRPQPGACCWRGHLRQQQAPGWGRRQPRGERRMGRLHCVPGQAASPARCLKHSQHLPCP